MHTVSVLTKLFLLSIYGPRAYLTLKLRLWEMTFAQSVTIMDSVMEQETLIQQISYSKVYLMLKRKVYINCVKQARETSEHDTVTIRLTLVKVSVSLTIQSKLGNCTLLV